jgi:CRP-like cAMP-binding protein
MAEDVKFAVGSFKKNAYIYIEDQADANDFHIIRSGKVIETRSRGQIAQRRRYGRRWRRRFLFGVLSCMARRYRIGTVQALEDTTTIIVKGDQFGALIQKMAPIAMKIIRLL